MLIISICSAACTPSCLSEALYNSGICQRAKTKLNAAKATKGLVNTFAKRSAREGFIRGRISQSGVPRIINGGAISVISTCCSMCMLNKYFSLKMWIGEVNATARTITPVVKVAIF